jgi:1-deoxy-D-xylulose-5-phosphate reductoisomerase
MVNIAILGSTGSIGQNAIEVARRFPERFRIVGLSANSSLGILRGQIKEFRPRFICVGNARLAQELKRDIGSRVKLFVGQDGLLEMAGEQDIDRVLLAISGSAALLPLLRAIESGKDIALANKEALVMAGPILMRKARQNRVNIIPVDSEQSAIWQCLDGQDKHKLKTIYLTASGGPFRKASKKDLKGISIKKVLMHPRWKMGRKVTVDSATLMNKGLEILEAMYLFNVEAEKVKVLIHPQAIIHSMVEFIDGIVLAQLSVTDMRIPIQYALSYPERLQSGLSGIDFLRLKELNFERPNFKNFPCLRLAYQAARESGTAPSVLNASNEVCVEEFLKRRLPFIFISKVVEDVLSRHRNKTHPDLKDILEADAWARNQAHESINKLG